MKFAPLTLTTLLLSALLCGPVTAQDNDAVGVLPRSATHAEPVMPWTFGEVVVVPCTIAVGGNEIVVPCLAGNGDELLWLGEYWVSMQVLAAGDGSGGLPPLEATVSWPCTLFLLPTQTGTPVPIVLEPVTAPTLEQAAALFHADVQSLIAVGGYIQDANVCD